MQRCADCGHPNRPGVRFCTHCGKPEPASGATAKGPTAIVAVVVLAVGLFAFLSIRPIAPRQAGVAVSDAPAQIVEPSAATGVAVVGSSDAADVPVVVTAAVTAESRAPIDAVSDVDDVTASAALGQPSPAPDFNPPALATNTGSLPEPPLSLDSAMRAPSPGSEVLGSGELALPTAAPLAMPASPAPLAPRQHISAVLDKDAASRAHASPPPASTPAPEPSPPLPALSSPARHAAVDAAPARRSASRSSRQPASWVNELRAEMAACEGDFLARTICRETAKHQHCESANAWGKVPECPAARLPDFANFN